VDNLQKMDTQREFAKTAAALEASRAMLAGAPPTALRGALAAMWAEEIWTSTRLAGSPLERAESDAIVRNDRALGGHRLDAYLRVADYARATRFVREAPSTTRRRGYLAADEPIALHTIATRRTGSRPGGLREATLPAFPGGMVPSPAWLIPQALTALVERTRLGPPPGTSAIVWIADTHARYERIHPFADANGRVGRLLVNLLLQRCGYIPFVVRPRDATGYLRALRAADARSPWPLAIVIARSLAQSYASLTAALLEGSEAMPLSALASGARREALYKAAQRGRLRTFRRGGRLMTTPSWIEQYDARTARP